MWLRKSYNLLFIFLFIEHILGETRKCGPLQTFKNVELRCFEGRKEKKVTLPDCQSAQLSGTVVEYKCKAFHIPFENDGKSNSWNEVSCNDNGKWIGLKNYESFRCKEDCGRLSGNAKPLVLNGVASNSSQWPWHGTLFRKNNASWKYICGGTLIRNQVLITAAHCLTLDRRTSPRPEEFKVVLGAVSNIYEQNLLSQTTQSHTVARVYISENYDPDKGFQADIAVMYLKDNVEFTDDVIPVCLPNDYSTDVSAIKTSSKGKVGGFGLNEKGELSEGLFSVEIDVRSSSECFNSLRRVLSESQYCAGSNIGGKWQTLCNGDSGGGMCFLSNVHQKYYIHGITSSGDADKRKGICQNFAVFTRIYSFLFWVRDIVEEIFGEIARDLHQQVPYPYDLRGTERDAVVFRGLPREWENRITSFSLSFAEVDTDAIIDSFDFAKSLVSFNLSHVTLQGAFRRRALLPHLASFHLDALEESWVIDEGRRLPPEVNEEYLRSLLFFDKDFERLNNWNVSLLLSLRTDIQLTLSIFKVLHLNFAKGEISMNSLSFCEKILHGISHPTSEFILQNLALRRCMLNSFDNSASFSTLYSLTLEEVVMETEYFLTFLSRTSKLRILRLNPISKKKMVLNLNNFPQTLSILVLGKNVRLNLNFSTQNSTVNSTLFQLLYLSCDFCADSEELLTNIATFFPNLKGLLIRSARDVKMRPFLFKRNIIVYIERKSGNWIQRELTDGKLRQSLYSSLGGTYFWTSEIEFNTKMRLKSFEKTAITSHAYSFSGKGKSEQFNGIPTPVQQNLKSIYLESLQISAITFLNSVSSAPLLKSIVLKNVLFYDTLRTVHFQLESAQLGKERLDYISEFVGGKLESIVIPFQNGGQDNGTRYANILHRAIEEFNSFQIQRNSSTLFLLNALVKDSMPPANFIYKGVTLALQSGAINLTHFNLKVFNEICELFIQFDEVLPPDFELPGLLLVDNAFLEELHKYPLIVNILSNKLFRVPFRRWLGTVNPSFSTVRGKKWLQISTLPYAHTFALSLLKNSLSTVIY